MITLHLPVIRRNQPTEQKYIGRHRPDTIRTADANWSPLHPADRIALAPTYWANRHLPAGADERTGHLDPAEILAASTTQTDPEPAQACTTRVDVLAEMRGDLDATAKADVTAIFAEVGATTGGDQDGGEQ